MSKLGLLFTVIAVAVIATAGAQQSGEDKSSAWKVQLEGLEGWMKSYCRGRVKALGIKERNTRRFRTFNPPNSDENEISNEQDDIPESVQSDLDIYCASLLPAAANREREKRFQYPIRWSTNKAECNGAFGCFRYV